MSSLFSSLRRAIAAITLTAAASSHATIISSFVVNGDGTTTYTYIIDNSSGPFDIAAWSLEFDLPSLDWNPLDTLSGGDVTTADANWFADEGIPVAGLSAQDFISLDPSTDVLIGSVLGGFSFTSFHPPGNVTCREFSPTGESLSGVAIGPVIAVPEGEPWMATLVLGGLALAVSRRMRPASQAR
jgi:hypothetical protein